MNKVLFQDFCSCTAEHHSCKSHQEEYVGWRSGNQPCDQKVAGSIPRADRMASIRSSSAGRFSTSMSRGLLQENPEKERIHHCSDRADGGRGAAEQVEAVNTGNE
ncbi:hypothetical protein MHYP_G00168020 [Metynnis hypsauchen]